MRRFNAAGLGEMEAFLRSLTTDDPEPYPGENLVDAAKSEELGLPVPVERPGFKCRFELAGYLYRTFRGCALREPERDKGLWAWLALYWFEDLCPKRRGRWRPGDMARWIPRLDSSLRYYRHLVLGPYLIFRKHSDNPRRAMCVLCQPVDRPGEVVEQIASRPQLVSSSAVVAATTRLYCDPSGTLRKGAGGKGPGSARRLADVLMQFDLTYDLHTIGADRLRDLLPKEFDSFRTPREASGAPEARGAL